MDSNKQPAQPNTDQSPLIKEKAPKGNVPEAPPANQKKDPDAGLQPLKTSDR